MKTDLLKHSGHYSSIPLFHRSTILSSFWLPLLLDFAPDQRFRMAFQIIGQYAQRACRTCDFLERATQILLGGSVLADKGRVGVIEYPVGGGNCAAQPLEGRLQPRRDVCVDAIHRLARVFERLAKGRQRLCQISADRFVWQLVELCDDAGDFRLDVRNGAWNYRNFDRIAVPIDVRFRRIGIEIKSDEELSSDQIPAPKLCAQSTLLDQTLHERVAFLNAADHRSACRRLFLI